MMKKIVFAVLLALSACVDVDGVDTSTQESVTPDAASDDLTLPIRKDVGGSGGIPKNPNPPIDAAPPPSLLTPDAGTDEGRKGGETGHCTSNCG